MKKTIRKIFSVLVAACLCTSMVPALALADQADQDFINGQNQNNIGSKPPGNTQGQEVEGYGVGSWSNEWASGANRNKGTMSTQVYGLVRDDSFKFASHSPSRNFPDAAQAITDTASDPLFAEFGGTEGEYEYTWIIEDVHIEADGSYKYMPHTSLPTFTGPSGTSGTFNTVDSSGDGIPVINSWQTATFGPGTRFTHSITSSDGLENEKIYRYTVMIRIPSNATMEPIAASIMVSTLGNYQNYKLFLNGQTNDATSIEGYLYYDPNLLEPVAPALSGDTVGPTSPVYASLADVAASQNPTQNITSPQQLTITDLENMPDGMNPYQLELLVHLGIPSDMPAELAEGDSVPVYRYDQKTGQVQEHTGTVVKQTDAYGNPVLVDGQPLLTVEMRLSGTSAALGSFALGYKNEAGSFKVTASSTDGGTVSPAGEKSYPVGSSPEFVMNPQAGYKLVGVALTRNGQSVGMIGGTLAGNVFTLNGADAPDGYAMADGDVWIVEAMYDEVVPDADAYTVSASLTGKGEGWMDITSGADGSAPYRVDMNSSIPAAQDDLIWMPSKDGLYLDFFAGSGYKLKSLKINGQEYSVVGTSYFISVLTENISIEAEYDEGLPEPTVTRTITYNVEGGNGAISGSDGTEQTSGTLTVNFGSTATITLLPKDGYMVDAAMLKVAGAEGEGTNIAGQVTQEDGKSNLQIHNVLEDMELTVTFKQADSRVNITVENNKGGTVTPSGYVQLANGVPQRVIVTPNPGEDDGYVLGSITMNGAPINDFLTSRNGGKFYSFKIVRADNQSADYGANADGTTDKVLYINDVEASIVVSFDAKTPTAPALLNITTEVNGDGGAITPSHQVPAGSKTEVWLFPDEGKRIQSVMLNGVNVTSTLKEDGGLLEIENIQTNQNVVVTYEDGYSPLSKKKAYTITASAGTGGSVTPASEVKVYEGKSQTFTFAPATNYEFSVVNVNGAPVDPDNLDPSKEELTGTSYTMKDVRADANLVVTFKKSATSGTERDSYEVEVNAGEHGSVIPSGVIDVARGANLPLTIKPDKNYSVDQINVMSKQVAASGGTGINMVDSPNFVNGVYTQYDVQDDLVIEVLFKEGADPDQPSTDVNNMIRLGARNAEIGAGVVLEPGISGLEFYKEAGTDHASVNFDFTLKVAAGYELSTVTVNGKTLPVTEVGESTYKITVPKEEITTRMVLKAESKTVPPSTQVVDLRTITVSWTGNGTVSPSGITKGVVYVETGESQTFYFLPEAGNRVGTVTLNGSSVTVKNNAFTIDSVTQDMRLEATFVEDPNAPEPPETATVSVKADTTHGFVSVGEGVSAAQVVVGGSLTITFKPDSGYETHVYEGTSADPAKEVKLNGGTLHVDNVPATGKQYYAEFTPRTQPVVYHSVVSSAGANGTISPEGTITVTDGSSMTFTFLGDVGYTVDKVWITRAGSEGVEVSGQVNQTSMTYTVTDIKENVEVWASFKKGQPDGTQVSTFEVTATAGVGGSVSPDSQKVGSGAPATVTFMPLRGYELTGVSDNGTAVPKAKWESGSYTIDSVTGSHAITAAFAKSAESNPEANKHDVFLQVGPDGGGTISPSGVVSVPHGGSVGFSIIPDEGYKVDSIEVTTNGITDKKPFNAYKYTLFTVTAETTIVVNFVPGEPENLPNYYQIQATSSTEGTISPAGTLKVAEGGMAMFSFQPNDGYRLSYLVVDGNNVPTSQISRGQYSFVGVTSDHTIHAVFCALDEEAADFVTVNAGIPSGGSIDPSGAKLVKKGTSPQYTVSAFFGYTLDDIRIDGESIFADGPDGNKNIVPVNKQNYSWTNSTLTLKNIQADANITVLFRKTSTSPEEPAVEYSRITVNAGANGSVSYNNGTTVIEKLKDGATLDVSIIPDEGYALGSLEVKAADGKDMALTDADSSTVQAQLEDIWRKGYITLTASQVNPQVTINVTFRQQTEDEKQAIENGTFTPSKFRTIDAQSFGRGTITPHGMVKVAQNASITFSMVPVEGYELSALRIDGKDAMNALRGSRTYTFNPGGADKRTIEATFSKLASADQGVTYKVRTAIDGRNGATGFASIEEMTVVAGGGASLYFWPDSNTSKLVSLSVVTRDSKGEVVENLDFAYNVPEYILSNISGDTTVTAHFDLLAEGETTWSVTPAYVKASVLNGGGSVSPEEAMVPKGCEQTFNLFPDDGREVSFLRVNGEIIYVDGGIRSYSMVADSEDESNPNTLDVSYKDVSAEASDVTVEATVDLKTSTGSAEVWPPERVIPSNTPASFYVKPEEGYTIKSITVDGNEVPFEGVGDAADEDFHPGPYEWASAKNVGASGERRSAAEGGAYTGGATISPALYQGNASLFTAAAVDDAMNADPSHSPCFYSVYRFTVPNVTHDITALIELQEINQVNPNPNGNYYFVNSASHSLEVTSDGGGTVSPVGKGFLPEGEVENIRLRTFTGYYLESVVATYTRGGQEVTEDLTSQVTGNNLRFVMGREDVKIHATFKPVDEASYVKVELGEALDPWGNPITDEVVVSPTLPGEFVRDVNGTGKGTQFFFTPPHQDQNDPKWVLDWVEYNGKRVSLTPDSNYVTVKLTAGGSFKVKFRELEPGHEIITPVTYEVTGKVTSGQGEVKGVPAKAMAGGSVTVGLQPAEGWMVDTENCFDWYAEEEGGEKIAHPIAAEMLANGSYTLNGIDRDHEITAAFVQFVDLTIGWTNGDNGYVTPNTMNGDPIKIKIGTSVPFIVAPYEGYDVKSVVETMGTSSSDVTGKLRQSAATSQQLLAMPGHENFTIKNFKDGWGVTGPVRESDAQTQSLEPVVRSSNEANGVVYAAAPESPASAAPALQNFNFAYGSQTAPIQNDTSVMTTWTKEENVVKKEERTITVEIVGGVGGTVDPMVGHGVDGEYITFNFFPEDGWAVRYIEVTRGNKTEYFKSGSAGGKEDYTYGPIAGDGSIKVGFDSIVHPGTNSSLSTYLRQLQSLAQAGSQLAQTGDLVFPVIGTLLGIAVLAVIMALITGRRRRSKKPRHA